MLSFLRELLGGDLGLIFKDVLLLLRLLSEHLLIALEMAQCLILLLDLL